MSLWTLATVLKFCMWKKFGRMFCLSWRNNSPNFGIGICDKFVKLKRNSKLSGRNGSINKIENTYEEKSILLFDWMLGSVVSISPCNLFKSIFTSISVLRRYVSFPNIYILNFRFIIRWCFRPFWSGTFFVSQSAVWWIDKFTAKNSF